MRATLQVSIIVGLAALACACGKKNPLLAEGEPGEVVGRDSGPDAGPERPQQDGSRPRPSDPPPVAGGSGGTPMPGPNNPMGGVCSSDGWCCSGNTCCNDRLGVCEQTAEPGTGPVPVPPPPVDRPGAGPGVMVPGGPFGGSVGSDLGACEVTGSSSGRGYCDAQLQCEGGRVFAYCEGLGDGAYCGCDREHGHMQFQLDGSSDGHNVCQEIGLACAQGIDPDAPATCSPSFAEQGRDYCSANMECRRTIELGPGLSSETTEYRYTHCNRNGSDWSCECSAQGYNARIELAGDQDGAQICPEVMDLCSSGPIETTGEPTCAPRFQSASRDLCDVELECGQTAQLGGQEVRVLSYRHANCQRRSADGPWICYCNGFEGQQSFELSGDDSWALCTTAGERCRDL